MADVKERSLWRVVGILLLFILSVSLGRYGFQVLAIVLASIAGGSIAVWFSHRCGNCGGLRTKLVQKYIPTDGVQGPSFTQRKIHCFTCDTEVELPKKWDLSDELGLSG